MTLGHLVELRIEHVFVVDEADAGSADRAHEGRSGQRQCGRGRDHRQHVRIVLEIVRQDRDDNLGVAAPAVGEQRADRTVDQAGDQGLLLGGTAFAFEVTARDAPRRVESFLVVDGQRQEVDALLHLLRGHHGGEHLALAVGRDHGPIGLAGYLAGLEDELAPAPVELNFMNVEHCDCLSRFSRRGESHEQDGEKLSGAASHREKTASSDPAMAFGPSSARTGEHSRRLGIGSGLAAGWLGGRTFDPPQDARDRAARGNVSGECPVSQ